MDLTSATGGDSHKVSLYNFFLRYVLVFAPSAVIAQKRARLPVAARGLLIAEPPRYVRALHLWAGTRTQTSRDDKREHA